MARPTVSTQISLARGDEHLLLPGVVRPPARKRLAARLLRKVRHPLLELGPEVADEALNGPGKRLTESCADYPLVTEVLPGGAGIC